MLQLTHFQALLVYALIISIAFAFLTKRSLRDRILYTLWSFLGFVGIAVLIGWLLFPLSR